jgi:hypothetical protein
MCNFCDNFLWNIKQEHHGRSNILFCCKFSKYSTLNTKFIGVEIRTVRKVGFVIL